MGPVKTYRLISFLGIHVVYDLSRKPGDRVVKLDVLCTRCREPSYKPLRTDEVYKVVLPSFLASGGDGYQMLKEEVLQHDSGKHRCLFLSPPHRCSGTTVLVHSGELLTMPERQRQRPECPCGQLPPVCGNMCLSPPSTHTQPSTPGEMHL